jgi:hypothetical protein
VQAENLHREAALLSNELHTYRDEDVDGVKPVIDKILDLRKAWKAVRSRIDYFAKNGKMPDAAPARQVSASEAELRVERQRLNVNIWKYEKKIVDNPDHPKMQAWQEELARMKMMKADINTQLTRIKYEATQ